MSEDPPFEQFLAKATGRIDPDFALEFARNYMIRGRAGPHS